MKDNIFQICQPNIIGNDLVRVPQQEVYSAFENFMAENRDDREIGVVLPVGCGKSGCIAIAPFAFESYRTLVVAPNVRIAEQLYRDFDPTQPNMFYTKTKILSGQQFPEPVEIRGTTSNRGDLDEADVVITNIQQLQGSDNRWLSQLPNDYFDLILFDEGHHSVATTWEYLKSSFPKAKITNFSATPLRSDGQKMAGEIIYSYPVSRAIQEGYCKQLTGLVLNPTTLKYIRKEDGIEIEVPLEEVIRLGEEDSNFRRGIVSSRESLITIVDASIGALRKIREETGEQRLKIIASALNYEHCIQIVEAYRERGLRADYVHSREDSSVNNRVFSLLENHELDVIIQVRKLGEGFDHPYLSVAAVFSIFLNLSPFVQFIGRIMRVIIQNVPNHILNRGIVVFHSGANVAKRWEDFREFSEADQDYFAQLLPIEELDFSNVDELVVHPKIMSTKKEIEITKQTEVLLEKIHLIENDPKLMNAIRTLYESKVSPDEVRHLMERLQPTPTTKIRKRQAARRAVDEQVKNEVGRILGEKKINPMGHELDTKRLNRTNFIVIKSTIDRQINEFVNHKPGERHDFTSQELNDIEREFDRLVKNAIREVFHA